MILFLYVLREYFKYVIGTVSLAVFLFVLFDFIHKTTRYFMKYQPSNTQVFYLYLYEIPIQIVQALPIASLLASVICMVLLSRTNEITAMRAAGMGPLSIGAPLVFGGACLGILSFLASEFVLPKAAQKMRYIEKVLIEKAQEFDVAEGSRWVRSGNRFYSFRNYDPLTKTIGDIHMIDLGENFRPTKITRGSQANYFPESGKWNVLNIRTSYYNQDGTLSKFEANDDLISVSLPFAPDKLKKELREVSELSIQELGDFVERGEKLGLDVLSYKVEWHIKFAYPFAALIVSLIGLRFAYRSERSTETAKGILIAFAIGISYWFVLMAGRALGKRGDIDPAFAAWMSNLVILAVLAIDAYRTRRAH